MKTSTFATLIFFGSVVSSPHPHLHHHAVRHSNQQEESSISWVTEVVVKTVQVTATVWVTPLAEPTHTIEEYPAVKQLTSSPNVPSQSFESSPSAETNIPFSEIAVEKSIDTTQPSEPQPSTEEHTPSLENTSEKNEYLNDEITTKNQFSETVALSQVNPGKDNEVTKPLTDEVNAPEPSTPAEPITTSQIPSETSLGSNITAIHDHATATTCSPSSPCNGDITYYDPGVGYGACGWKNSKSEPVVALPHEFMGSSSNGNSYCGKTITIVRDGKKSTARVVDKCMGCTGYSIDLSDAVFSQLAALSVGRTSAKWWVN